METLYSNSEIQIELSHRRLSVSKGLKVFRSYPIAIGKPETPTPLGTYKIVEKIINPGGILGTRWLGLNIPDGPYGIHGTWAPSSIGKAVSNGCIRLYNKDVEELFPLVRVGTTVVISAT